MNITVLGGGAWGTAIAISAARHHAPQSVCLWARNAKQIEALSIDAENKQYLPAIPLPDGLFHGHKGSQTRCELRESSLVPQG